MPINMEHCTSVIHKHTQYYPYNLYNTSSKMAKQLAIIFLLFAGTVYAPGLVKDQVPPLTVSITLS